MLALLAALALSFAPNVNAQVNGGGHGLDSKLELSKSILNFPELKGEFAKAAAVEKKSLTITNGGLSALTVTVHPPNGSKCFYITAGQGTTMIQPHGQSTVTVEFAPASSGTFSGVITITSDATVGKRSAKVLLAGSARRKKRPTPTPTRTTTPSATATASRTATATVTITFTATSTATPTATPTATVTATQTATATATRTSTRTATATATTSATPTSAATSTPSATAIGTTPTATSTPSPTATSTAAAVPTDVLTYHNDNARTAQNLTEQILTPANVKTSFGPLFQDSVDGLVDAQPLIKTRVNIPAQGTHNVVYVATENDSVYAFDADTAGPPLWNVSVLGSGEAASDDRGCSQVSPQIGITSTPVIDPSSGPNGTIYLVAMSKNTTTGIYFQRIHALDMTSGAEEFGGPVTVAATFPPGPAFSAKQYKERAGLLLLRGQLITAWASHCDIQPYNGWIMAYNESTLVQTSVLDITPNGSEGAIWQAGGGIAADTSGNIYFLDGNGTWDTTVNANGFPTKNDFGNGFIKLSDSSGLQVADFFEPFNTVNESNGDTDLGSGGALVLPDMTDSTNTVRHLAVGAGKDGNIYLVDRDNMGKFNSQNNSNAYQVIAGALNNGEYAVPAYFNGTVYYGGVNEKVQAFSFSQARLTAMPISTSSETYNYPGTSPSISANGISNAIVWTIENASSGGVLHAYDATNLANEFYNSGPSSFAGNKFVTPTIANGKVYVGTPSSVAVFGLK